MKNALIIGLAALSVAACSTQEEILQARMEHETQKAISDIDDYLPLGNNIVEQEVLYGITCRYMDHGEMREYQMMPVRNVMIDVNPNNELVEITIRLIDMSHNYITHTIPDSMCSVVAVSRNHPLLNE